LFQKSREELKINLKEIERSEKKERKVKGNK